MSRTFWWFTCAGCTLLVGIVAILNSMRMQIPAEAIAVRQRLPYVSLAKRLAFKTHKSALHRASVPVLSSAANDRLNAIEQVFDNSDSRARALSLQMLHSSRVAHFISRPGFGLGRMGRLPGRELLDYGPPSPIPQLADDNESESGQTQETANHSVVDVPVDEQVASVPSQTELELFHRADQIAFTDPWSFGDVKDRFHVAGFVSHGFTHLPAVGDPGNKYPRAYDPADERNAAYASQWKIARLELVSILKFDVPAVYVSDQLPRMQDLAETQTRPLTLFEQQALASLQSGEDLITEFDANEIRMLGSLRSVKQCQECHAGQRGSLLGAFSYRLRRHPPLPDKRPGNSPAT